MPKRMEQNLFVHIGKSDAKVTNNKTVHSGYCSVEYNYRQIQLCGLCRFTRFSMALACMHCIRAILNPEKLFIAVDRILQEIRM